MKHIKIVGFLALAFASVALGVGSGEAYNPMATKIRFLNQDVQELDKLIKINQDAADHFKGREQHGIVEDLELQITRLDNHKVQLKHEIQAAQEEAATNIDTTTATVVKKSCGSCNKPKTTCVVREKKACGSCTPKVERPKKECHTCNKCHRPVAPKATKCGSCHHKLAQELDQENVAVIDETDIEQDDQGDEIVTEEEVIAPVKQPKKSCGSCKPKCVAKPTCSKPAVEEVTVTEVVEDPAA